MIKRMMLLACAACVALGVLATPAHAHEKRKMCGGSFTAGWGHEPPYSGVENSVQVLLADAAGKPVTTVPAGAIKVEVATGAQKTTLVMNPTFDPDTGLGTPGDYRAFFVPTAPGTYTFTFSGKIGKCAIKNAKFVSSEKTFDDIKDVTRAQFPVIDPPGSQISTKLAAVQARLEAATSASKSAANSARTLGYIGIGLGAVALVISLIGVTKRR